MPWRYVDGPVAKFGNIKHGDKETATDWELIEAAATCHSLHAVGTR